MTALAEQMHSCPPDSRTKLLAGADSGHKLQSGLVIREQSVVSTALRHARISVHGQERRTPCLQSCRWTGHPTARTEGPAPKRQLPALTRLHISAQFWGSAGSPQQRTSKSW